MKCAGLAFLAVLLITVIKLKGAEGGQVRSVCILIPAYNPEDFAEGENEEEEIRGWGPGPSQANLAGTGGGSNRQTIVTHTDSDGQDEREGAGAGQGGESSNSSKTGSRGSMTDPSKPPGPNPKWGYWEWDSESRRWELEDFRRKKRQAPGSVLAGKVKCGPGTVIHIDKVTLGFSIDNRCRPVRSSCQATSTLGRQVLHCEGRTGPCDVTVLQKFMKLCGRRTNYAQIQYECIAESERQNICENKSFKTSGILILNSPSFSGSVSTVQTQALSCECEVRKGASPEMTIPWLRTQLDTKEGNVCGEEMLLVDAWNDKTNRFALEEEICGRTSLRGLSYSNSVIKLTYIPSATYTATNGFLLKLQGKPNSNAELQVTCSMVSVDGGPSPAAANPPPVPGPGPAPSPAEPTPQGNNRPQLPFNFDISKYPGLLNKTLAEFRNRHNQQQGSAAGQVAGQNPTYGRSGSARTVMHPETDASPNDEFSVKGTSGTLSAVVASLASVILIMGSIGGYLWYRRLQKKKRNKLYYDSRSTVRSEATLYAETTYQDPQGPGSSIPITPPSSTMTVSKETGNKIYQNQKSPDSLQKAAAEPPALPKRPPRPKKEKCRRLASQEQEVVYDNRTEAVKVVVDKDYASLEEISSAMGLQNDLETKAEDTLSESSQEIEIETDA